MTDSRNTKPEQSSEPDNITPRERRLFFALDEDADGLINKISLTDALKTSGLGEHDKRLASLYKRLAENNGERLTIEQFSPIVSPSVLLLSKPCRGD